VTLEAFTIWQSTFVAQVPPTDAPDWPDNLADWLAERLDTPKLSLPGITLAVPPLPVVFGKAAFRSIYSTAAAGDTRETFASKLANAYEAGMQNATVTVKPGDSIGVPSPTTTWSVVASSVFDAPSIAAGKNKVLEIASAPDPEKPEDSAIIQKLYEAVGLLTVTTTGSDSVPPPSGPNSLVDTARGVA